jgi:MOSC domain-containing protein YiiM
MLRFPGAKNTLSFDPSAFRIPAVPTLIEPAMQMNLVSLNVGLPREVIWHGMTVTTGIFKNPVHGRIALRTFDLDGDRQADLTVHGGEEKAVYCYPLEHYEYWKQELPGRELPMGMFGENFTLDFPARNDSPENSVHIGDHFAIGSAEVVVTQPRLPCYKLGIRFQMDDMVKRFHISGRTGFYLAITREGEVGAGDEMKLISQVPSSVPVSEITRLFSVKSYTSDDVRSVERALQVEALPESWKDYFRERLASETVGR